ncbi:hypothetical protein AMS68_001988 [Peltaster fructicola]|uniref:Heterokaryon incompatibility domain-containing protein n=1 Tax=Peltaster fructicola TaxID=286661 RepID=A0A6H0XP88_9PEZI|nr:hypothetical protein AMS68_001988 [Peltaster fructicola]
MMRLINIHTLKLQVFDDGSVPPYAIASHRWQANEPTYQDYKRFQRASEAKSKPFRSLFNRRRQRAGFDDSKVRGFCAFLSKHSDVLARSLMNTIEWLWIDTCCIDQTSMPEVSESINLMFRWYSRAHICLAYLFDCDGKNGLEKSSWFDRGWTLQELLTPSLIVFLDSTWEIKGHKRGVYANVQQKSWLGEVLNVKLSIRTGIPVDVLADVAAVESISCAVVMSWMNERRTTRTEDQAYCLLGIFGVSMPLCYGEMKQATIRLLEHVQSKLKRRARGAVQYGLEDLTDADLDRLNNDIDRLDEVIYRGYLSIRSERVGHSFTDAARLAAGASVEPQVLAQGTSLELVEPCCPPWLYPIDPDLANSRHEMRRQSTELNIEGHEDSDPIFQRLTGRVNESHHDLQSTTPPESARIEESDDDGSDLRRKSTESNAERVFQLNTILRSDDLEDSREKRYFIDYGMNAEHPAHTSSWGSGDNLSESDFEDGLCSEVPSASMSTSNPSGAAFWNPFNTSNADSSELDNLSGELFSAVIPEAVSRSSSPAKELASRGVLGTSLAR